MTQSDIVDYEVTSSWWAGYCITTRMRRLAASWFAWKVRRKWSRYVLNKAIKARLEAQ